MTKCQNCAFWTRKTDKENNPTYVGKCVCPKIVYTQDRDNETPQDGLGYWDGECYQAGFETGEEFGCIHGVKKG